MKTSMVSVRIVVLAAVLLLSAFPESLAADYVYTVRRGVAHGHDTLRSASAPERRRWRFQPKQIGVSAIVKERMANTKVKFTAEPTAAGKLAEITMRIPENAYVNHLEMKIGDDVYVGGVKERAEAKQEFDDALNAGESASLVESKGSSFTVLITLQAGESAEVTVGYEEYLVLELGSYNYNLALDTSGEELPVVLVEIAIEESDGLNHIAVPKPSFDCAFQATMAGNNFRTCGYSGATDKAWIRFDSLTTAQIMLNPTQQDQQSSSWGGSNEGLSLDLVVRITPLSTFAADAPDGGVMMIDQESGHFVHIFNAPRVATMRKAVVLMVDRSGSMKMNAGGRTRMAQAKEAVRGFLSRLEEEDYFALGMFNTWVEWWRGSGLKQATPRNVQRAVEWLEWVDASGGTDINQALVESLAVFDGGSAADGSGHYEEHYQWPGEEAYDPCWEWEENEWKRTWGAVTAACCGVLTAVFITSIGVAVASSTTTSALARQSWTRSAIIPPAAPLSPPAPHPHQPPPAGVMVQGGNFGLDPTPAAAAPLPPPPASTHSPRTSAWVSGSAMGAEAEAESAHTAGAPDAPPLPGPSAPPASQNVMPPSAASRYSEAPPAYSAPPPEVPLYPAHQPEIPLAEAVTLQAPAHASTAPPVVQVAARPQEQEEAYVRGSLGVLRRWSIALLVCSLLALALSWSTYIVPLSFLASLFGIVTASVNLHAVRRAVPDDAASSSPRPRGCCCQTWASCISSSCGLSITTSVLAALAWILCLIWAIILMNHGHEGHRSCFPEEYDHMYYDHMYYDHTYYDYYDYGYSYYNADAEALAAVLQPRNSMVVFLSDGKATSGTTHQWDIAENARLQVSELPSGQKAAVFGVAFGRDADLELLQLVSKGTGATATRIYDDNEMDVQLQSLFDRVSSAQVTGLDLQYSALAAPDCASEECMMHCASSASSSAASGGGDCLNCAGTDSDMADACRLTLQPQTTLFTNSVMVRAGKLPEIPDLGRATAVKVVVSGRWEGVTHKTMCDDADYCQAPVTMVYGPGQAQTLEGEPARGAGQIWSHLTVHEALKACPLLRAPNQASLYRDTPRWTTSGCAWGVAPETVDEATALAVEANLVTPLTSLVVRKLPPPQHTLLHTTPVGAPENITEAASALPESTALPTSVLAATPPPDEQGGDGGDDGADEGDHGAPDADEAEEGRGSPLSGGGEAYPTSAPMSDEAGPAISTAHRIGGAWWWAQQLLLAAAPLLLSTRHLR